MGFDWPQIENVPKICSIFWVILFCICKLVFLFCLCFAFHLEKLWSSTYVKSVEWMNNGLKCCIETKVVSLWAPGGSEELVWKNPTVTPGVCHPALLSRNHPALGWNYYSRSFLPSNITAWFKAGQMLCNPIYQNQTRNNDCNGLKRNVKNSLVLPSAIENLLVLTRRSQVGGGD